MENPIERIVVVRDRRDLSILLHPQPGHKYTINFSTPHCQDMQATLDGPDRGRYYKIRVFSRKYGHLYRLHFQSIPSAVNHIAARSAYLWCVRIRYCVGFTALDTCR